MGQLHELTGHLEKAVASYRRYLIKSRRKIINFIRKFKLLLYLIEYYFKI